MITWRTTKKILEGKKIKLNQYRKFSYKVFGDLVKGLNSDKLKEDIRSAHMDIRADAYLSTGLLNTLIATISSFIFMGFLGYIFTLSGVKLGFLFLSMLFVVPMAVGLICYFTIINLPALKASQRGKKINLNLPYALNFISAMSSAGVTPTEIFGSLAKQDIYGEIKSEAEWIYRDVDFLGYDIVTALKRNIKRSPSEKFKQFSQGVIITIRSGGSLKNYFMNKAKQYMKENRQEQKQLLESLSIMAESYVTAAVAGILMLLIVIPLMMLISGQFNSTFLYLLIFVVSPSIHLAFAVVINSMSPEV